MRTEPDRKDIDEITHGIYIEGLKEFGGAFFDGNIDDDQVRWIVEYVIKRWSKRCTQSGLFWGVKG